MTSPYPLCPIAEIVGDGLISDGDWIESKDQDPTGGVRLIQLADIGDGRYVNKSSRFLTHETASRLKCTNLLAGDIIIARMPDPIGRACIFPGDAKEAITVVDVCILRVSKDKTDARWLMNAINADFTRKAIEKAAGGTTRTRISRGSLEKLLLPTPPLVEQEKIAAILATVDNKLDIIARQIEATQTLKRGLMQTLFSRGVGTQDGNGRWVPHTEFKDSELGEIPVGWIADKLSSRVTKVGSGVTPKGGSDSYLSDGIPLIRSQNVLVGKLALDDVVFIAREQHEKMYNSALVPNDVLLNITGASIGRSAVLPADFAEGNVNQHVCIIRTKESLIPSFLCQYLNSVLGQKQVEKFQAGGNREGLNYQQIRSFDLPIPPVAEQQEIADVLGCFDEKIEVLASKQTQYQSIKRGLMQKLLTGEWRVKLDIEAIAG
ncbi:restriction endonuclease subunit S [Achromobacter sp. 2789STDY5608621]|uniref:restriction endonuclease subunit S n=1 Tax=Achromobacter sp. 2789STDY5608621 TaxID=1806496 RepID=UPI0006C1516E|nr:restriction endonuclease subunit S [Achromobacter sp. 2789STDY5608621]CUJ41402.1 Type I restriction enzyme EcoKI specificity protein [Achromobacter sp. 2789STDY5608621]